MNDVYYLRLANGESLSSILCDARAIAWREGWNAHGKSLDPWEEQQAHVGRNPYVD